MPSSTAALVACIASSTRSFFSSTSALSCPMRAWMSGFLPAPSMIVVFSFSMRTRFARPSIWSVTFSSLMPRSSEIVWPAVRTAMAEARRLHGRDLQAAAQLVHDECRKRLPLDILGDDEERLASLDHRLEDREQRLERRQLLLVNQDVGILELDDHLLGVGDEIRREVAAVKLHALDDVKLSLGGLCLLDRDHALVADLFHRLGDHLANRSVTIRGDRADLRDLLGRLHFL